MIAEAVGAPVQGAGCALTGGTWYSVYDDTYITDAKGLDVDHRVPLAEAWDSGASEWTAARRQAYANDLDDDRALIAVTAKSNRSKADQDPATWMPPSAGDACDYITHWVAIKTRWSLTADPTEHATLTHWASQCPNAPVQAERT
ncbi:hypothetical protein GCM10012280_63010 [Wenjunlia tyrosinilytica]|uniref:GmrSD restriction endonucleases C-terminal domain-containing protein n=2 Tax=Wenjunlia tyrosinilytica TaxID=1544741 RepID=A0A918E267_9ACTN|nr:hypothetical protein GCM10012280_63010 [Wenjunlia tyrosinilytica]